MRENDDGTCHLCHAPRAEGNDLFCAPCQQRQDEYAHRNHMQHVWHVWMNQRQDERRVAGEPFEGSLYAFKRALEEVERLPLWLRRARTGTLPTTHKQCSRSSVEPIEHNRLICALGRDVTQCPILQSLYASVAATAESGPFGAYSDVTVDDADVLAARTCVWHIFTTELRAGDGGPFIDTSEGYMQDEGDRRFWSTVYGHLSGAVDESPDDDDGEPERPLMPLPDGVTPGNVRHFWTTKK